MKRYRFDDLRDADLLMEETGGGDKTVRQFCSFVSKLNYINSPYTI